MNTFTVTPEAKIESERIIPLIKEYLGETTPTQKELTDLVLYYVNEYKFTLGEIDYIVRCIECEIPFSMNIGTIIDTY